LVPAAYVWMFKINKLHEQCPISLVVFHILTSFITEDKLRAHIRDDDKTVIVQKIKQAIYK
jgi:hypothetical protein